MREWLANDLRSLIESAYEPGDSLPSERQLARKFGVGRDVVRAALADLRLEGLIVAVPGVAHKVRSTATREELLLGPQDTAHIRVATAAECRRLGWQRGTPVIEVTRGDLSTEIRSAHNVEIRTASSCQ